MRRRKFLSCRFLFISVQVFFFFNFLVTMETKSVGLHDAVFFPHWGRPDPSSEADAGGWEKSS